MWRETWDNARGPSRAGLIGGIVLILALALAAAWWVLRGRNAVLFADLEPGDAAAVVAELERMKVSYRLGDDGTQILVPEEQVHAVRLKLLGSGLPMSGGIGFEVFDDAEFGMTEFAQRINFQRALQGELTRTIMSLKEVKYARVHLVLPEASLFRQSQTPPSAAVTLFLKPGAALGRAQIEGIQRLVSASVQGLAADAVTIVDRLGTTLSAVKSADEDAGSISTRLKKKKEVEDYLTEKAARVLERTFGPGKAIVSIDVALNFDQSQTTREEVLPGTDDGALVRRRESRADDRKGADKAGAELSTEVEYRLGRSVEQIVSTPGNIERLSIGVMVPAGTPEQELAQVEDLVAMAVGLNRVRGDAIAVHAAGSEWRAAAAPTLDQVLALHPAAGDAAATAYVPFLPVTPLLSTEAFAATRPTPRAEAAAAQDDTAAALAGLWSTHARTLTAVGATALLLLAVAIGGLAGARRRRQAREARRITAERERILGQLKAWISADELEAQGEGGTP